MTENRIKFWLTKLFTSILDRSSSWIWKLDEIINFWLFFMDDIKLLLPTTVFWHSLLSSVLMPFNILFILLKWLLLLLLLLCVWLTLTIAGDSDAGCIVDNIDIELWIDVEVFWLANNDNWLNNFMTLSLTCIKQRKMKRWHAVIVRKHHQTINTMQET